MTDAIAYAALCLIIVAACIIPLGRYMAQVFMDMRHPLSGLLGGVERLTQRLCGIAPKEEYTWWGYAIGVLLVNLFGFLLLFALLMLQGLLPLNPQNLPGLPAHLAFNIAASFLTNTDWQSYTPESTLSHFSQMVGLTVQNFLSAASGMVVAVALFRGLCRKKAQTLGNPYADIVKAVVYILLPLSLLFSLVFASQGVIQNMAAPVAFTTLETATPLTLPQGPVASQESIKLLGGNGGGFFNANSAHPYENPTPLSNLLSIVALLLIPAAFVYSFGIIVGDPRQSGMLLVAMTMLFLPLAYLSLDNELTPNPHIDAQVVDVSAGNLEGKETRFSVGSAALFGTATAATSGGAVNAMHDSFMPMSGFAFMLLMQLGEVVYGGVGSGMYGILMFTLLTVFMGGLMVGRTPEFLGKKLGAFDVKMASLVMLVPTTLVLVGTAIAVSTESGRAGVLNPGAQGFSEILYALSSAANNNGSAFGGLGTNTPFYNLLLGIVMLLGRFGVMLPVLAVAGSLAAKNTVPFTAGTLPTHTFMFACMLVAILIIIGALNYIPALALGPVVEHMHMLEAAQ